MNKIYLDNAATTKPDREIAERDLKLLCDCFYNPSALYKGGMEAKKILEKSREVFLKAFKGKKIIFTSCGTEADDTAIFSFFKRGNAVTTLSEHSAVFKTFEALRQKGFDVRYAALKDGGAVDENDLLSKVDKNTTFVSVVHVNNETGAINDIASIAKRVKAIAPKAVFHSDGVQALCKTTQRIGDEIDLYSVSAHKIKALKGVGALLYNEKLHVAPYIIGGGQEGGLRSGTENLFGIKVFADAFEKYYPLREENLEKTAKLKELFLSEIDKTYFKVISTENGSPYVISLSAVGVRGAVLQNMADDEGVIIGTGSACNSKSPHSRVLSSFITDKKVLDGAIRVSFSFDTKEEDVLTAVDILNKKAKELYGKINL